MSATRLMRTCDMTHSYVWHDSFVCVTRLILMRDMTLSYEMTDFHVLNLFFFGKFLFSNAAVRSVECVCEKTKERRDLFVCMTWLKHMCDMTHSNVWPDICVYVYTYMYIYIDIYSLFHLGWHLWMLFQSSKLKARRTSLLPRFSEKRPSSFELWAVKELSKMSHQMGWAVRMYTYTHIYVRMAL